MKRKPTAVLTLLSRTLPVVMLMLLLAGCGRMFGWTSSGIPKALDTEALIRAAGASQGITLEGGSGSAGGNSHSVETERRFSAKISSGTSGRLLAAYRQEVQRVITNGGGTIHGTGITGSTNDVEDFSYDYSWGENEGIVKVYSFEGTNGQVRVVSLCYEHPR